MGRRVAVLELSECDREALQGALARTDSRKYARRCHLILRKAAEDRPSNAALARELGLQQVTVAKWIRRYRSGGLAGLRDLPIPGRPAIFDAVRDAARVRQQVQESRQRLRVAHAQIEQSQGQALSEVTLRRFLKSLAHASGDYV